jgi:hypothetical protein
VQEAGLRVGALDPARAWAVYKRALHEPVTDSGLEDDIASVQCGRRNWGDGTIAPCAYFTRQFSLWNDLDQRYVLAAGSTGEGILGFAFGFQFPREHEAALGEFMLWSKDFGSREAFLNAVEAETRFQLALRLTPVRTELTVDCPLSETGTVSSPGHG